MSSLSAYWRNRTRREQMLTGYAFVAPIVLYTLVTGFIPVVSSLYLSFTNYNMMTPARWIGLQNYVQVLFHDSLFWRAMLNTAQYSLEVLPLNVLFSLCLALLVNQKLRGITIFRTLYYLPVVTSSIAVSMIWLWLYNKNSGLINLFLGLFGLGPVDWLGTPGLALHSLVLMRVWKGIGWNMVIYLAGLQGIPKYLYEAADIDGASGWKKFSQVTWPSLRPVTYYIVVMGLISTFQTFAEIYAMTNGGPLGSTTTVAYLIYQRAFGAFDMGNASAVSFILFVVIFGLSLVNVKYFQPQD
ncbi:MAG: sugar ABC transporter permease [Firmicutes bacterium]|nr:sugar ABC transporter permease [Bacillota bacterium]